jgi:nitrile hydratase accessory protein
MRQGQRREPRPPAGFDAPWQLRAYAVATALEEGGLLDRASFREEFESAVSRAAGAGRLDAEESYRRWVAALERTLLAAGHVSEAEVAAETRRQGQARRTGDHTR